MSNGKGADKNTWDDFVKSISGDESKEPKTEKKASTVKVGKDSQDNGGGTENA